jgi:hypothetical protein
MQAQTFSATLIATFFLATVVAPAQNAAPSPLPEGSPKPEFDPSTAKTSQLPLPSPYDKMLAIDVAAGDEKVDWNVVYDAVAIDVDANAMPDKTAAALALGVKIADGLVAVKTQDIEKLNNCATQIESLAKKLGAGDDDLRRARLVRENANKGKWLDVFLELGFLQADIMKILLRPENANMRRLIIATGWMQGARHVTYYLGENYNPEISNVLREPLLVAELDKDIQALPEEIKENPRAAGLAKATSAALPIVTVEVDEPVSAEKVAQLKEIADSCIRTALGQ